jgi:hypothetical protein
MKLYHFNPYNYGLEVFERSESEQGAIVSLIDNISERLDKQLKEVERNLNKLHRKKFKYSNKNIHCPETEVNPPTPFL